MGRPIKASGTVWLRTVYYFCGDREGWGLSDSREYESVSGKIILRRRRFFFSVRSSVVREGAGVFGCCSRSESEVVRFNLSVCVVLGS